MEPVLLVLMAFLVLGSLVALEIHDLLSAVIAAGVVGLGLSIAFLLLGAPDIAITQVVVEVLIVTMLVRAVGRTGREEPTGPRRDRASLVLGGISLLAIVGFTIAAFAAMPGFGTNRHLVATWYLDRAQDLTGAANVVTAIILDFRAYDTLGEATVILAAVVGAIAIVRRTPRRSTAATGGPPAPKTGPTHAPSAPEREPEPLEVHHA